MMICDNKRNEKQNKKTIPWGKSFFICQAVPPLGVALGCPDRFLGLILIRAHVVILIKMIL